ncbi:hypothetical protein [uncultured Desulfosarcina sp.]|uniref:STN domain-containing protein n=1 Tax=uncultured Desulfosarcina sp. TaxID=218289 RepID=UPI0029C88007|nr:hypothetical protein [uncultured Desulfosarcina sp.]
MKSIFCLIVCFFFQAGGAAIHPALAADPLISLTAKNEPLGEVLETITRDTGYRFNLNRKWKDHPVSATIGNLPLEQGLKRLLRSLNYSIVWESDRVLTIMVFGKADPRGSGSDISFASPSQTDEEAAEPPAETESPPADEPEPADAGVESADAEVAAEDPGNREPAADASTPETGNPDEPSAEPAAGNPPATGTPSVAAGTDK